jgi:hypothetical protein
VKTKNIALFAAMTLIGLSACSTSPKVSIVQAGDQRLSCTQLKHEFTKLDEAADSVRDKKGVTGTNVAAALFWVPGLAYTYYDAGQAEEAIQQRRAHITQLYIDKNC